MDVRILYLEDGKRKSEVEVGLRTFEVWKFAFNPVGTLSENTFMDIALSPI